MNQLMSNASAAITEFFNRFRLDRILMVLLAGFLVLFTAACNPSSPSASGVGGSYTEKVSQPTGLREYTDRADGKSRPDLETYSDGVNDRGITKN
jgi:hypothetical protein